MKTPHPEFVQAVARAEAFRTVHKREADALIRRARREQRYPAASERGRFLVLEAPGVQTMRRATRQAKASPNSTAHRNALRALQKMVDSELPLKPALIIDRTAEPLFGLVSGVRALAGNTTRATPPGRPYRTQQRAMRRAAAKVLRRTTRAAGMVE